MERSLSNAEKKFQAAYNTAKILSRSRDGQRNGLGAGIEGKLPNFFQYDSHAPPSQRQQQRGEVMSKIRKQSEEIDASQKKSTQILMDARRQFDNIAIDKKQIEIME